jgi:hypothetical protein
VLELPPWLTEFEIKSQMPLEREICWHHLPSRLTALKLTPTDMIYMENISMPIFIDTWSQLSSDLTFISVGNVDVTDADAFLQLPPNLVVLRLGIRNLPENSVSKLPSSLATLELRLKETPAWALSHVMAQLPPDLLNFTLVLHDNSETDIADLHLQKLPQSLQFMDIPPSPLIVGDCIPYLPDSLGWVQVAGSIPRWFPLRR